MTARRRGSDRAARARAARAAWQPRLDYPGALPISARSDEIRAAIKSHPVVVVAGDTGSGKTTQLPKMCLELGRGIDGQIALTQPRRLAAHAVAARLAEETGLPPAAGIGVAVRFDDRSEPSARIRVMTDGILLTEIARDPELRRYDTVIIDEAHERSLNIDFLTGCLAKALRKRSDLRVVITSATINTAAFAEFFDAAPVINVEGRTFPVEIRYQPPDDGTELASAVHDAAAELLSELAEGDLLVFLPGEREIEDVRRFLGRRGSARVVRDCEVLAVYGRLPDADQRAVFSPGKARRIVLATNIAETSLTLPRIVGVIDSGLVRISRVSTRSKVQRLATELVSQASARQRAGRCGRLAPGICVRLYSEAAHASQPAFTDPEVLRTDLASVALRMLDSALGDVADFPWLEPPDTSRVRDAQRTLRELGATTAAGRLTRLGRRLARLSVDPRLGRTLLGAAELGVLDAALIVVAAMAAGDPRLRPPDQRQAADTAHEAFAGTAADFETFLAIWAAWNEVQGGQRRWMIDHFLSPRRMFDWRDVHRQLVRQCSDADIGKSPAATPRDRTAALARAFTFGFAVQMATRDGDDGYQGARGIRLRLHPSSALAGRKPPWIVGLELVRTRELFARNVIAVKPKWLLAALGDLVTVTLSEPRWDKARRCPVVTATSSFEGLVLKVDRTAPLASAQPDTARELTVRHAIVHDEAELDVPFMDAYRDRLAEIAAEEGRLRRVLLKPAAERERWFMARLPAAATDSKALLRLLGESPELGTHLTPGLDDLADMPLTDEADGRPRYAEIGGERVALEYRYAPGRAGDGVRLALPAHLAAEVRRSEIDAAVPALLAERIELYLRKLPKQSRVRLQPIAASAQRFVDELADRPDDLPLDERLRLLLAAELGLGDAAFERWADVDDAHLTPEIETMPGLPAATAQPTPVTTWVFGTLPPLAEAAPFIALAPVAGDAVVRREFRQRTRAEQQHRDAVACLLLHAAAAPLALVDAELRERPFVAIQFRARVAANEFASGVRRLIVAALADGTAREQVRDAAVV